MISLFKRIYEILYEWNHRRRSKRGHYDSVFEQYEDICTLSNNSSRKRNLEWCIEKDRLKTWRDKLRHETYKMVVNVPAHKMHLYYHTWEPHATGIPEILAEKKQKSRINLLFRGIKRVPCLAFSAINTFSFGKGASIHDIVAKIKIKKGYRIYNPSDGRHFGEWLQYQRQTYRKLTDVKLPNDYRFYESRKFAGCLTSDGMYYRIQILLKDAIKRVEKIDYDDDLPQPGLMTEIAPQDPALTGIIKAARD